jgi:hypothetical protein
MKRSGFRQEILAPNSKGILANPTTSLLKTKMMPQSPVKSQNYEGSRRKECSLVIPVKAMTGQRSIEPPFLGAATLF